MAVTRRQKEVLDFLESFVTRNGYSPSFEEIARGLELKSLATVHKHITNLEKKGLLDRVHNRSRSIDVVPVGTRTRTSERLPLMGRIAAGLPVEAAENAESISLHDVVGNKDVFALEVRGDSMRDEHIISGDYVLVERTRTARQGEIVVALVRGSETTLKRFYLPIWRWIRFSFPRVRSPSRGACWACCAATVKGPKAGDWSRKKEGPVHQASEEAEAARIRAAPGFFN
jgi:repressor LexA